MIPAAALLPHETHCRRCGGEGTVPGEEDYTSSTATEPHSIGRVPCPAECADGVVIRDRRERERVDAQADFTRLRNDVAFYYALAIHQADHLDQLIRENRAQRQILVEQARLLDRSQPMASPSAEVPPTPKRAVGGGATH